MLRKRKNRDERVPFVTENNTAQIIISFEMSKQNGIMLGMWFRFFIISVNKILDSN